jgi:hypothetical protein
MGVNVQTQIGFDVPTKAIEEVLRVWRDGQNMSKGEQRFAARHDKILIEDSQERRAYALENAIDVVLEGREQLLAGLVNRRPQEWHHVLQRCAQVLYARV